MMRFAMPKGPLPPAATDAGVTTESLRTVNRNLVAAINAAYAQASDNGEIYKKWFGTADDTRLIVLPAMTKLRDFANGHATVTLVVKTDSEVGAKANAYAYEQGRRSQYGQFILNLGVGFGTVYDGPTLHLRNSDGDGQALKTIAHELCHLVLNANISPPCPPEYTEEKYREEAVKLVGTDPKWAAWNADNYGYFIEACSPARQHDALAEPAIPAAVADDQAAGPEDKALRTYLQHVGLDKYAAAFQAHGVTSLKLLRMLDTDVGHGVKTQIMGAIRDGWAEGDNKVPGSPLAANQVETVTADDVQAWIEKEDTTAVQEPEPDPEVVKAKQEQLKKAIDQVRELREKWSAVAKDNQETEKKNVAEKLDTIIAQFRSENLLATFPPASDLAKNLTDYFTNAETALARVSALTTSAVRKTRLSAVDLIFGHQLLRGRYVDANGMIEAPGGAVLAMPRRTADSDLFGPGLEAVDFSRSYHSESAMMRAERLIETHASSFATASEAAGAAFMGSGIGAMSLSVEYTQAKEERSDASQATSSRRATEIQTRYHWSPMRQIVFATNEFRLGSEALAAIRSMIGRNDDALQDDILEFMKVYGSHVFGRVTLGGWYKYTATAEADSEADRTKLERAVAQGMSWAVSASATYVGLGGAAQAATSFRGTESSARVSGREYVGTFDSREVRIATTALGGVDGLPREEWIGSLQYPVQWRVIQRDAPVPIWKIIGRTDPARLGAETQTTTPSALACLADRFEEVWVRDIFAASLDDELRKAVLDEVNKATLDKHKSRTDFLENYLSQSRKALGSVGQLEWSKSDITSDFSKLSEEYPAWSGPGVAIYQNQLYCFYFERHDATEGNKDKTYNARLIGNVFDGTVWCSLPEPPDKDKEQGKRENSYRYWLYDAEPAFIGLEHVAPPRGFLKYGVHQEKKETPRTLAYQVGYPGIYGGTTSAKDITVDTEPVGPAGPALVQFKGTTYLFYTDPGYQILCRPLSGDGKPIKEQPATKLHDEARTDKRIAATAFDGKLYCAYLKKDSNGKLHYLTTSDGTHWEQPTLLADGSENGPALAVFAGPSLCCAYAGKGGDAPVQIVSTRDGLQWSGPTLVGTARSGHAPALATFSDQRGTKLYCFYRGTGHDTQLSCIVGSWVYRGTMAGAAGKMP